MYIYFFKSSRLRTMRISKILDGRATVRLPFEYSRTQSGSGYFPLILRTNNRLDSMLSDCTRNWISRSRAIAQVWFLNNLLLFDRTLLALNGQTICSSSVKVPTSDYPSTGAQQFRLTFAVCRCKMGPLSYKSILRELMRDR